MWPASMFAKRRTESEIRRMNWPRISSGTIRASSGFGASGIQLLKYLRRAVPADALEVREDEGQQRERERDRERGGRRVDAPESGCRATCLAGERQRDEPEHVDDPDEEHQRRDVREPAADRLRRQPLLGDLHLRDLVDLLADRLAAAEALVRAELPAHQADPEQDRQHRAEHQVRDRLVDRHVEAGRGGSGPTRAARTRSSGRTRRARRPAAAEEQQRGRGRGRARASRVGCFP